MTLDGYAHCIRTEMTALGLAAHRITVEAGSDLDGALTALADLEQQIAGTRKALLELPRPEGA